MNAVDFSVLDVTRRLLRTTRLVLEESGALTPELFSALSTLQIDLDHRCTSLPDPKPSSPPASGRKPTGRSGSGHPPRTEPDDR